MTLEVPLGLTATEQWLAKNALNPNRRDFTFVMHDGNGADQENEIIAGMAGLMDIDRVHRRAELYAAVNPRITGRGYGRKIYNWCCNYAFIVLDLNRVYGFQQLQNVAANRVVESQGWTVEGTLRQHQYYQGSFIDRSVVGIVREDWEKLPWRADPPLSMEIQT